MQQVMRIGDTFVQADDDIKDIVDASNEIYEIAKKYKTDMLTVIGKGDKHNLATQHHEGYTELWQDLAKSVALIKAIAKAYDVEEIDVAEAIKFLISKGA